MDILIDIIAFSCGVVVGFIIRDIMKGKYWK